jgi:hypothetical protein
MIKRWKSLQKRSEKATTWRRKVIKRWKCKQKRFAAKTGGGGSKTNPKSHPDFRQTHQVKT